MADVPSTSPGVRIPTLMGVPHYTQRTRLDGREFTLRFMWNMRAERWALDISDDTETLLVGGIWIVANWPLLRPYQWDPRVPPGDLRAIDLSADGSPPGVNDMAIGQRCELVYFAVTDL